jgi:hypothetical protein
MAIIVPLVAGLGYALGSKPVKKTEKARNPIIDAAQNIPNPIVSGPPSLGDVERLVVGVFCENGNEQLGSEDLARALRLPEIEIKHALIKLGKRRFVRVYHHVLDYPDQYDLTDEGIEYGVENLPGRA